jgi:hypothetical protein
MAARTLTYTINMNAVPRAIHAGVNQVAWDFNSGATKLGTLSDVVLLGKIPSGALITNKSLRFGATASTAGATWQLVLLVPEALGTLSSYATLIASMTSSATAAVFQDVIPYKLSLSDDRAVQYAILALNASTGPTETVSISFQGFVQYSTDGTSV